MIGRRRSGRIAGAILAAALSLLSGTAAAQGPERSFRLDNGLRVFLYEKRDVPLLNLAAGFDVGSKDETDATSGLVHLLEHVLLFRGGAAGPGAGMRRHGAYLNGHTGQDLSIFEMSLPSSEAAYALGALKELLFGPEIREEDLEREKEVIGEELAQMEDDPEKLSVDRVLQALFPGHPYGRSVYGRPEIIAAASAADLLAFHGRYFAAGNAALAIVGDFEAADMEGRVREAFGPLPKGAPPPAAFPMAGPLEKDVSVRLERDVRGGYLTIGCVAPDYNHPDQYAMRVLAEALGRGINPLLGGYLRGQRDSVQNVSMSYLGLRYGGAALLTVKADPKDLAAVERAAVAFLKRSGGQSFSKRDFADPEAQAAAFDYLEMAKNQIRFAAGRADESGLQLAEGLVRHLLLNTRDRPLPYLEGIGRVDAGDLRRVAGRYFGRGETAAVSVGPRREKDP